jgi:hypothetical protein
MSQYYSFARQIPNLWSLLSFYPGYALYQPENTLERAQIAHISSF